MKLAVVGSRSFTNENKVRKLLELYHVRYGDNLTMQDRTMFLISLLAIRK